MRRALLVLVLLLGSGRGVHAQPGLDRLQLYVSTLADIELQLGEVLECLDVTAPADLGDVLSWCAAASRLSLHRPDVVLVDGRLRLVRVLLAPGSPLDSVLNEAGERYGEPYRMGYGSDAASGLRYWEYRRSGEAYIVSEVRSRSSGEVRIRLSLSDPGDPLLRAASSDGS